MSDSRNLHYAAHGELVERSTTTSTYGSLSFAVFPENLEQFTVDHIQPLVVRGTIQSATQTELFYRAYQTANSASMIATDVSPAWT